jgi:hypothetical protein
VLKRGIVRIWFRPFRLRDCLFQPSKVDFSFPKPNHCVLAQFVFHIFSLSQRRARARAGARIRVYFAMQTFFGSVKKPASAKATARQAQRFGG